MTPMRTSSLKHNLDPVTLVPQLTRTPRSIHSSKENFPRSRSASPRKPLQEIPSSNIQPSDLVKEDTEEFLEHSKRLLQSLHIENVSLKAKLSSLSSYSTTVDSLQSELHSLTMKNHELEKLLQTCRSEHSSRNTEAEVVRLSEELEWHAKLHLFAEKERMRLLDLLEFAGKEGQIVGKEYIGLKQKLSMMSLESNSKCLI